MRSAIQVTINKEQLKLGIYTLYINMVMGIFNNEYGPTIGQRTTTTQLLYENIIILHNAFPITIHGRCNPFVETIVLQQKG